MTNSELKVKVDEFLSSNVVSNVIINNLDLFIKISLLYEKLSLELKDVKFSEDILENCPKLDLYTKIDLVKKLYKKYNYPLTDDIFEKILRDGTVDFREYEYDKDYFPDIKKGITDGSAGVKKSKRFVSVPNSGYITDAVILSHELGHYLVGIPEGAIDHMTSETFAIFTEFLMEDELSKLGYREEMKYVRKFRFKNTLEKNHYIPVMAYLRVYLTFGDFEFDSVKKLYGKMTEEIYENDLNEVKNYFSKPLNKVFMEEDLYYTFGCIYAYYMFTKLKEDPSYIDNIFKAYTKPYIDDLNAFSEALGLYEIEESLSKAIDEYKSELNEERLDKSV